MLTTHQVFYTHCLSFRPYLHDISLLSLCTVEKWRLWEGQRLVQAHIAGPRAVAGTFSQNILNESSRMVRGLPRKWVAGLTVEELSLGSSPPSPSADPSLSLFLCFLFVKWGSSVNWSFWQVLTKKWFCKPCKAEVNKATQNFLANIQTSACSQVVASGTLHSTGAVETDFSVHLLAGAQLPGMTGMNESQFLWPTGLSWERAEPERRTGEWPWAYRGGHWCKVFFWPLPCLETEARLLG